MSVRLFLWHVLDDFDTFATDLDGHLARLTSTLDVDELPKHRQNVLLSSQASGLFGSEKTDIVVGLFYVLSSKRHFHSVRSA